MNIISKNFLSDVHKQFERKNQTKRDLLEGVRFGLGRSRNDFKTDSASY